MSFVLLMIAFVLTGLISIANKTLVQMGLGEYRDAYMLAYFGVPSLIGLVYMISRREHGDSTDRRVGFIMGIGGALSTLFFLIALEHMKGIVAFPVRSLGNLIVTGMVGIAAWRERLSISQWIGIALSLIAIWLIY